MLIHFMAIITIYFNVQSHQTLKPTLLFSDIFRYKFRKTFRNYRYLKIVKKDLHLYLELDFKQPE